MTRMAAGLIFALISMMPARAQLVPPRLLQSVEPKYDQSRTDFALDPVTITLHIDEAGIPVAFESPVGIPANVVRSIVASRYSPATQKGKAVPVSLPLMLQIRRPYSYFQENTRRPYSGEWEGPGNLKWEEKGWDLTERAAASLEKNLRDKPESEESRAILAAYASTVDSPAARQLQTRQIAWLVQNMPSSRILGSPAAMLFSTPGPFANNEGYEQVRKLWLDQLARNPSDPAVVAHAAYFLRLSEPENAEKLLLSLLPHVSGASTWLGELYALSAVGVTRVDYKSDSVTSVSPPEGGFGKRAQLELKSTADLRVLFSAADALSNGIRALTKDQTLPAGYKELCVSLLQRVKVFDASTELSCDTDPESPGTVEAGGLTKSPQPQYPPDALRKRIEGTLRFDVHIQKDGKLKDVELVSGPLVFFESTMAVFPQWEYKPTLLNGKPVEVLSMITINFKKK